MSHRRLSHLLRQLVILGASAILLIPDARGHSPLLGWLPLWLLGMPLSAWWALHRFPFPQPTLRLPKRRQAQARRLSLRQ